MHRACNMLDYILDHKQTTKISKQLKPYSMFFDKTGMKIETNNRKTTEKLPNNWKLNALLNNPWVKEEVKGN